jgi:nucleotide-binding universal stress UspA family protein
MVAHCSSIKSNDTIYFSYSSNPPRGASVAEMKPRDDTSIQGRESLDAAGGEGKGGAYILCGTNFSGSSAEAANAAAVLAKRLNEWVFLVHSLSETLDDRLPPEAHASFAQSMQERLHAEAERVRSLGAPVKDAVLLHAPDTAIHEHAQRTRADLIVCGHPEPDAMGRLLAGSVAESIAESSSVPTLMVRTAKPFEAWTRGERALRILVATDCTERSEAAVRWAAALGKTGPCVVTLCHVKGAAGAENEGEQEHLDSYAHRFFDQDIELCVVSRSKRVDLQLIHLAEDKRADLLVVGTERSDGFDRFWHRPVSRAVLRHARVSVACIPSATAHAPAAEARFITQ